MKAKLKRVPSKSRRNGDVRDRIHKAGGAMFDELIAVLTKGHTNVTFLDLNGNPVTVMADAVGIAPTRRRRRTERLTTLERNIQRVLEENELDVDISTKQALALLERTGWQRPENLLKKYKAKRAR